MMQPAIGQVSAASLVAKAALDPTLADPPDPDCGSTADIPRPYAMKSPWDRDSGSHIAVIRTGPTIGILPPRALPAA